MKLNWKLILLMVVILVFVGFIGMKEGFQAGIPGVRCGVDLPSCSSDSQCMNGFCGNPSAPLLPKNQLPVYP